MYESAERYEIRWWWTVTDCRRLWINSSHDSFSTFFLSLYLFFISISLVIAFWCDITRMKGNGMLRKNVDDKGWCICSFIQSNMMSSLSLLPIPENGVLMILDLNAMENDAVEGGRNEEREREEWVHFHLITSFDARHWILKCPLSLSLHHFLTLTFQ